MSKPRLLWVGDAGCPSGFARATHEILSTVCQAWDVTVLGINYRGDPHQYPYKIYAAAPGGDWAGVGRLIWMCDLVQPHCIVVQQDPWNFPHYTERLEAIKEYKDVPIVGNVAVDGLNCRGDLLNPLSLAVFWTQFGLDQAEIGGFRGRGEVIPLGVDSEFYTPGSTFGARREMFNQKSLEVLGEDAYIVGYVGRNQPRKRLDLTIAYFAHWLKAHWHKNAYLYLHVAPTGDEGYDLMQLARYFKVLDRLLLHEPPTWYGISEELMRSTYRSFDAFFSTTQGEGMGLPEMEAMACGVPCVLPNWSALGDWAVGAADLIPCSSYAATITGKAGAIGGIMDEREAIKSLEYLYQNPAARVDLSLRGRMRVKEERFSWKNIGERWRDLLSAHILPKLQLEEGVQVV